MRFPPSFLDRLRSSCLISVVIGKRIAIKKHGREYHARCPFHNEKTPSFTINDDKGFFHCFGCGKHGDAISFVMDYERLTYPEAVEHLCREVGMELPKMDAATQQKIAVEKTLYDVMDAACAWLESQLAQPQYSIARDYVKRRGLDAETLSRYRIGYAPDDRTALFRHLQKAGFPQALQVAAGLVIQTDENSIYDRFRGRVMFPIRNVSGKIIAFGGRLIAEPPPGKQLPKYLNSPETDLFKKGSVLFNLDLAKRPAREKAIAVVMEGYMDVVSAAQSGVDYAVATLGTAVTPEHLRLLWQLCKEPVICLDGDAAGKRAMSRACDIALPLLKPGYSLRFAVLPPGEDPDSYIRSYGKGNFEKILRTAPPLSHTLWEDLSPGFRLDLPEGLAAIEDASRKLTDRIPDPIVKKEYLDYLRRQIANCRQRLWNKTRKPTEAAQPRSPYIMQMMGIHHDLATESVIKQMLAILLACPSLIHKSTVEETLSHLDISDARLDALRNALLACLPALDDELAGQVEGLVQTHLPGIPLATLLGDARSAALSNLSAADAWALWERRKLAYELAHLQQEYDALLNVGLDEATYPRFLELQQLIKKYELSRTFAPAEPDAA